MATRASWRVEREKFRAYRVGGETGTERMTEHMLYDMCSGSRLLYEVETERGRVKGFLEVVEDEEHYSDGEERWGGMGCEFCVAKLQRWVDSVDEDADGKKMLTKGKSVGLVW